MSRKNHFRGAIVIDKDIADKINKGKTFYSLRSGARYLGIDVKSLKKLADAQEIPFLKMGDGRTTALLFEQSDLLAVLRKIDFPIRPFKPLLRAS
jgi:hypothetical protein